MPEKVVFPGGAVDDGDGDIALASSVDPTCRSRLEQKSTRSVDAIAAAAIFSISLSPVRSFS